MNDLKKQVEDYQRQGAAASLEMQKAAQAVACENQRLRNLLKLHGVSQDDIEGYIGTTPAPSSTQAISYEPSSLRCTACGSTSIVAEKLPVSLSAGESDVGPNTSQQDTFHPQPATSVRSRAISSSRADKKTAVTAASAAVVLPPRCTTSNKSGDRHDQKESDNGHQSRFRTSYMGKGQDKNCDSEISSDVKTSLSMLRDTHCASKTKDHTDAMETSCDTAASILVDLHHHADTERARAALGCKGPSSCTVNNIKIFQLLENFS